MAELKQRFPSDLDYQVAIDTTKAVTEGIHEIGKTFWEALALVMLVVFLFLQGWRAALIPLLAVPVSLVGTGRLHRPAVLVRLGRASVREQRLHQQSDDRERAERHHVPEPRRAQCRDRGLA